MGIIRSLTYSIPLSSLYSSNKPIFVKCCGVSTESDRVSPTASWNPGLAPSRYSNGKSQYSNGKSQYCNVAQLVVSDYQVAMIDSGALLDSERTVS